MKVKRGAGDRGTRTGDTGRWGHLEMGTPGWGQRVMSTPGDGDIWRGGCLEKGNSRSWRHLETGTLGGGDTRS